MVVPKADLGSLRSDLLDTGLDTVVSVALLLQGLHLCLSGCASPGLGPNTVLGLHALA